MDSQPAPSWFAFAAAVLASALAYGLSTGVNEIWPLAWIAPIPILALAVVASARTAMIAAFLAYLLGLGGYLPMTGPNPLAPQLVGFTVTALVFAIIVRMTRAAVLRFDHWAAVFVFPVLFTTWDYFWPYLRLPYSQTRFLSFIQIASITGLAGITFLMTLLPAGVALAWYFRRHGRRDAIPALAVPALLCLMVIGWGLMRLAQPVSGTPIRVGLAATDTTVRYFRTEQRDEALAVVSAYADRVAALAAQNVQVVVLPEKFVGVTPAYGQEVRDMLANAARTHRVMVIAGLNHVEHPGLRNLAVVFAPSGEIQLEYQKVLLVPGWEQQYLPGNGLGLIPTEHGMWGVTVCRDLLFPEVGRPYGEAGVGLMLIPAWDFVVDRRSTANITLMRGVENGYAVARAAQEGLLLIADHHGRILADPASGDETEVLVWADVVPGPGKTFYSRAGDWFARANVAAAVLIVASIWIARRRSTRIIADQKASPNRPRQRRRAALQGSE